MKRCFTAVFAALFLICSLSVTAFAWSSSGQIRFAGTDETVVFTEDGEQYDTKYSGATFQISDGDVKGDMVAFGSKVYIELGNLSDLDSGNQVYVDELFDTEYFKFRLDKGDNSKFLKSVDAVYKNLDGSRKYYIEIELTEEERTDEYHITFDVYFDARKAPSGSSWTTDDNVSAHFSLWTRNTRSEGDSADLAPGQSNVFVPTQNESNIVTWSGGDLDIATLQFSASDDPGRFYAELSTKLSDELYHEYATPYGADLYVRNFVGSPSIDATSRATLTLYNPWSQDDDDDEKTVDPNDVYIYQLVDGELEDITSLFEYDNGNGTDTGTDGWKTRTRKLGTYVLSDTKLDTGSNGSANDPSQLQTSPATGSVDYVIPAALLLILSSIVIACLLKRRHD